VCGTLMPALSGAFAGDETARRAQGGLRIRASNWKRSVDLGCTA
jgi:hypothetical protein